ncbi:hypothetical protein QVA66_02185 [Staphylococcus chromogenes]|nr:hypothetical protein [Staphylococcus chromogenes]
MKTPASRPLTALIACCLLAFSGPLSACGKDEPTEQSRTEQAVSLPVDPPRVTLTSAGSAPQRVVAFKDSGASQHLRLAISDAFQQGTGAIQSIPATPAPAAEKDTLTAAVTATTTGDRDIKLEFAQPTHSNPERAADTAGIDGFQLGWKANNTGRAESVNIAAAKGASDSARQLAELHVMKIVAQPIIFPTEPIGPGATWTVENRVAGDSTMLRTTTYTLDRSEGDQVELSAVITQRPAVTALSLSTTNAGGAQELKVRSAESVSRGKLSMNLTKPLPTAGGFELATRVRYSADGSDTAVFQDFGTKVEFQ